MTPQRVSVLIVEDEYILASNLKEGLESFDYEVVRIVDSGEDAVDHAIALRPTIVLMDIRIRGDIDGIQAAEQIWQRLQIPVIYVTGHSDQTTVERATLTLPFGYILKPIREKELYVAIQTALSRYEHEQFFATILQAMGDGVIVTDVQLQIKYLNIAAQALTGWTLDDSKERSVTEIMPFLDERNQQPIEHPIVAALREGTTFYLGSKTLLRRHDGTTLPVSDSAALLRNNEGEVTGAVLVFQDDTQRRVVEERDLANSRALLAEVQLQEQQRLSQLKDDFLATTSHELRTPLSNIKLAICLLETVLSQQGALTAATEAQSHSVNRYLSVLQDQCNQELRLINDLLDLRSLEANTYPVESAPIQLQTFLPHLAEGFQDRANVHQQTLHVSVPPELSPFSSDRNLLTRIVSELLNNACKYTPKGYAIEVIVEALSDAVTPSIQIIIRNAGTEIKPDQQARIFEPFYRIPNSDPWKHGGTGLGLALVKKLVDRLQGTIAVTSDQQWTTFTVQLPLSIKITNTAD
ncbi:MAG: ATP-binding protein [Leptolyngbya sp. BL-A-14]